VDHPASRRLLLALAMSGALHLSLLYTVRFVPPAPAPSPPSLHARLLLNDVPAQRRVAPAEPYPARRERLRHAVHTGAAMPSLQTAATVSPARGEFGQTAIDAPAAPAELELPLPLDLTWYPVRQLDVLPQPLVVPQPAYPEQAAVQSVRGEVTLLVLVDEAGAVHEVSVVDAQPEGYFEDAARTAFQAVRFEPARKDGRAVRSRILVKVAFEPASKE
jgi:protein TonB